MGRAKSAALATILGIFCSLVATAVVVALNGGETNGQDNNCCGWTGNDNPDGQTGSYAYDNLSQIFSISEWAEPNHDWIRDRRQYWSTTAESKLNNETSTKTLTTEIRIHDQYYYNLANYFNTNLPYSKAAESENWAEEFEQGYSEIDMEIKDPWRITANFSYFWDIQVDAEKAPTSTRPDFYSELEYCNKSFVSCWYDITGWFEKKVKQQ